MATGETIVDRWTLIVVIAVVTYGTRLAGFVLGGSTVPPLVARLLPFVPVAAFAALLAPGVTAPTGEMWPRLLGAAVTALVVRRWAKLWAGLLAGMLVYRGARALLGG